MGYDAVTFQSYLSAGLIFAVLTLVLIRLWFRDRAHLLLVVAAAVSSLWGVAIAFNYRGYPQSPSDLLLIETLRYGAWTCAVIATVQFVSGAKLPGLFRNTINGGWILALAGYLALKVFDVPLLENTSLLIWVCLILSIIGLVAVEQLYRNTTDMRDTKLISVLLATLFGYDIYLFAYSLIFNQIEPITWQARGAVNASIALFMALGIMLTANANRPTPLAMSRPLVFYTTSLTAAGCFLATMAMGGYYVQLYGGEWGTVVQVLLLVLAIISIIIVFVSRTLRAKLSVWVNKNFFHHKYDYRAEWLRLINYLSQPTHEDDANERGLKAIASIFKCPGAALWLPANNFYQPAATIDMVLPECDLRVAEDSPFCRTMLEQEWVFSPYTTAAERNETYSHLLPEWINEIEGLWLVLPLSIEQKLVGFVLLTRPEGESLLNWEDLDLLKTVGRQVASYLDRHQAAELLVESRQFEAFNKLTAFIMHDLKNLIAQQALVVQNAAKHKDNPAFVEDAIRTIDNSVGRMSNLLKKLQHNEPAEIRPVSIHKALMEAVRKSDDLKPKPALRLTPDDIQVTADPDRLTMTLLHLVRNAQEATQSTGFVDVTLRHEDNNAIILIEDNGAGMDAEFVQKRLFRPFDTTKSGKGMGIGAYQAREYLAGLGGRLTVESTPGEGTTFTISLPAATN